MSDTIFYTLKLKPSKSPRELFEKWEKFVKPRGVTKKWVCGVGENDFAVEFNDAGGSETFLVEFDEKNVCQGCCKVFFPLDGDEFTDEKKSEFKALLNMLYSARSFFSKMEITDDYGLCQSFLDGKKYKIVFRELSPGETERAKRLYDAGHTDIREFIIALFLDLLGQEYTEDYTKHINRNCASANRLDEYLDEYRRYGIEERLFNIFIESFLYETAEFRDKGLLRETAGYRSQDLSVEFFSTWAFEIGINWLTGITRKYRAIDAKSGQALKLYQHTFLPLCEAESDKYNKCVLAYRYFVSLYDWLGFKYAN